jgi:colicin import membrane protein
MNTAALRPPESAGMGRGFAFALIAHALLFVALSAGVSWRSQPTSAAEAELWAAIPVAAEPKAEEPPPEPPPQAEPDRRAQQQKAAEEAAEREAELAIARDRARKEREKRDEAERQKKAAEAKAEKERQAKLEKEKADKADKAEKDKQAKAAKEADAKREALRQEQLRRIQGMAGATGGPTATGTAAHSAGPSASFGGRIKAKIKPLIIYTDPGGPEPYVSIRVTALPDGRILQVVVTRASTNSDWDRAVLRAFEKAETLPRDQDGKVPSPIDIDFKPRE